MSNVWIVVPCFNEALRLPQEIFIRHIQTAPFQWIFVNDGSTDGTSQMLQSLAKSSPKIHLLELQNNQGKAQAVRLGLCEAIARGAEQVGFLDADASTPPDELLPMVAELEKNHLEVVTGARIKILGKKIERNIFRHYLGRIFATLVSCVLRVPIYDSQCGAKIFRVTPLFKKALSEPFFSRWAFDVELLGRLFIGYQKIGRLEIDKIHEYALSRWHDPGNSRLSPLWMLRTTAELFFIHQKFQKQRQALTVVLE